jgi:NAD(P)-dependent dehydrogenase (short-subunit alcohol dehydrogenase family)
MLGAGEAQGRTGLLAGKVVAVTGAGSGIGRAAAFLTAAEGAAALVITDRNGDGLKETAVQVEERGIEVASLEASIDEAGSPDDLVALAVERFGRLDAAVNNAGVRGRLATIDEVDDELWDEVQAINLKAVFRGMRAQLRQMYRQGSGSIVNVASASVFGVSPRLGPYVASKTGLIGLSRVAAVEAGPKGVRVNVVCPGRTDTPLFNAHATVDGPPMDRLVAEIPLGRMGTPDELGEALIWLCSERSSFVNGAVLVVDGGRTVA